LFLRCSSLLFIEVNGPQVAYFDPQKFATSWLKNGRHSAVDRPDRNAVQGAYHGNSTNCFLTHKNEHIHRKHWEMTD